MSINNDDRYRLYKESVEIQIESLKNAIRGNLSNDLSFQKFRPLMEKCGTDLQSLREELRNGGGEKWERLKQKIRKTSEKAYPLLAKNIRLQWATGTRSGTLIGMERQSEPALVPTGRLLAKNRVPLEGELAYGLAVDSVNRKALSGCSFEWYHNAMAYAVNPGVPASIAREIELLKSARGENQFRIPILRLKVAVLRMIHLGATPEQVNLAKSLLRECIDHMPPNTTHWEKYAPLIGRTVHGKFGDPLSKEEIDALPLGTIVGVNRAIKIEFAGALESTENGVCKVWNRENNRSMTVNEKDVNPKNFALRYAKRPLPAGTLVSVSTLQPKLCYDVYQGKNRSSFPVVNREEIHVFSQEKIDRALNRLKNPRIHGVDHAMLKETIAPREALEEIMDLFETERPLELTEKERSFLENPFPLVWATSEKLDEVKAKVMSAIKGEVAMRKRLTLGKEITVVFTKSKKIEEVKAWLAEHNLASTVKVLSLGAGLFMQTRHSALM